MAFGKGRPFKENPNRKVYSFVIRTKDLPKPIFEVKEKQGEAWVVISKDTDTVAGDIVSIKHTENKYQMKIIKSVNLTLIDGDDLYYVTIPYSNLGRGLLNTLCSLTTGKNVVIGLYQTRPKVEGGKTYAACSVRQNDKLVRWKFNQDQLPAVKKIPFQGAMLSDAEELDTFLAAQVTELNKVLNPKTGHSETTAPTAASEADAAAPAPSKENDGEIPF